MIMMTMMMRIVMMVVMVVVIMMIMMKKTMMMVTLETAALVGVEKRLNPEQNIKGGAKYFSMLQF